MKKLLYIDSCIRRGQSRTEELANSFLSDIGNHFIVEKVDITQKGLKCLNNQFLLEREELIAKKEFTHPMFALANNFANADVIVIAAPFWDLSIPSILKVYIENICVDSITFGYDKSGLIGLCKATDLIFITTRGGSYENSFFENGTRYIEAMSKFWGIKNFHSIIAENLDIDPTPTVIKSIMDEAKIKGNKVANLLLKNK